jgi:hypothetical protein
MVLEDEPNDSEKKQLVQAAALGGKARAASMTDEERREAARKAAEARWGSHTPAGPRPPKATHGGSLKLGDSEIPCYVLDSGARVLSQSAMITTLGMKPGSNPALGGDRLSNFVAGKLISPFISEKLTTMVREPLRFRIPGSGTLAYGYPAEALAEICESILAAEQAGVLQPQQKHIAKKALILLRGFSRVGIVALVDEATGYQADRARDELHRILEAYIAKELQPWTKKFPDEFFKQVFRLHGWTFKPGNTKRPGVVGKLINKYIYKQLPPGVLDYLQTANAPVNGYRRYKHFQFLTIETGHPNLDGQIAQVTLLMRVAKDKRDFERLFNKAFPKPNQQLELLPDDEEQDD